jgi:hypothetical protein
MGDGGNQAFEVERTREVVPASQSTAAYFIPTTRALVRRIVLVGWYRIKAAVTRGGKKALVVRAFYVGAYVWIPIAAVFKVDTPRLTVGAVVTLVLYHTKRAIKETSAEHMQFLEKNYTTRKYALGELIVEMHRLAEMTADEVSGFQERTLRLIAQYVRDHRADLKGQSIFANLLIEHGDDVVVLSRDKPHRVPMVRHPKAQMAATSVFQDGEMVVIGDLETELPNGPKKRYRSFMVLPIYLGAKIVGALSIDSTERYHFDFEAEELWVCLLPYVNLLAWTLAENRVKQVLKLNSTGMVSP